MKILKYPVLLSVIFFVCILVFLSSPVMSAEEVLCPQVANYTMEVKLDIGRHTIQCTEHLTWLNTENKSTDELWFHLYWNAFQNNRSDFLQEGAQRWGKIYRNNQKDDWGYCRVDSIEIIPEADSPNGDLTSTIQFRHPDDNNFYDQTVFSVKLPEPIQPGQTLSLRITFHSKVPRPIHRTGFYKDYYFIAQWFPKLGVFKDGKWNCHQFHATTNFFADFGTYDVRITLPSSFVIGATGKHLEKTENGDGTTTHRFYQHSVHDFAWTASPDFLEITEDYEFAPGKSTEIILLLQPYHQSLKKRYMDAVKNALKYCSLWYGNYPYTTITCVDPAYNSRSGGMEYPTLFTGGAYFLSRKGIPRPEGVTIHEFGHGYFYGLVASNEFEDAWMDEGFTSFLDSEVYYAAYGHPFYSRTYLGIPVVFRDVSVPIEASGISRHRQTYNMDIMQNFTWNFLNRSSYGANAYAKAELMLRSLKRYLGKELFTKMIKAYSQRHWFKHPQPHDFYNTVAEFAGQDMSWFLDPFVYGSGKLDYAVHKINNKKQGKLKGWFEGEFKGRGQENIPSGNVYRSAVIVRRIGEVRIPVDVHILFKDGSEISERWSGQYRWKKFTYETPHPIQSAVIDPDFKLVSDVNRTNNSLKVKPGKLAAYKWTSRWLIWFQHALEFFALFGG